MTHKQLEVQIMGQSYLLSSPAGGESRLLDAVEKVDAAMCKIRDAGKVKARERIAVLAALNLAFELSQKEAELLQQQRANPGGTTSFEVTEDTTPALFSLLGKLDDALADDTKLL